MNRLAIKHRLLDRGMTLAALACQIGVPYDRLVKVVNGYRQPRRSEVKRIAKALAMDPAELEGPVHEGALLGG